MTRQRPQRAVPCPGPRPYEETDAEFFFGRERELGRVFNLVRSQRLSVLDAASASGKTSLLQAGLVPALRASRLAQLADGNPTPQAYPLLVNRWLSRGESDCPVSFVGLLADEAIRSIGAARSWYRTQSGRGSSARQTAVARELRAAAKALNALHKTAANMRATSGSDHLTDHHLARTLMAVLDDLVAAFGSVLLILDQFEEILGDSRLGHQAIVAVDTTFTTRREDVHQFISLRNDSLHLLHPLEAREILGNKRREDLNRLGPEAVDDIVTRMSMIANLDWDADCRTRLIATFSRFPGGGAPGSDVNLLGLQVVLQDLFRKAIRPNPSKITLDTLREYCQGLDSNPANGLISSTVMAQWLHRDLRTQGPDKRIDPLLCLAPSLAWIDTRLRPASATTDQEAPLPELIKPMVMHMADWLVTPAGFKRTMTLKELQDIAYERDLKLVGGRPAGRAHFEGWSPQALVERLKRTCNVALERLVAGHVLKEGMDQNGPTYELVHDQFGAPLVEWSRRFRTTPAADIAAPHAIADKAFLWSGSLAAAVPDHRLKALVWVGCTLKDVDFSGLSLDRCDFSRTLFQRCTFGTTQLDTCAFAQARFEGCALAGATFRGCDLRDVAFDDHCTLTDVTMTACTMDRAIIRGGSELQRVALRGGRADSIELNRITLTDCSFRGDARGPLSLESMQLLDVETRGNLDFERCALSGATVGATSPDDPVRASAFRFVRCLLQGAEFKNLDFTHGSLRLQGGLATGTVFEGVRWPRIVGKGLRAEFDATVLTGAVFLGCEVRSAKFSGGGAARTTEAKTIVFRGLGGGPGPRPTILGNVDFVGLDLENAAFVGCRFVGPVTFANCDVSGGTLAGSRKDQSHRVEGPLKFDKCSLAAMEVTSLDFTGERFEVVNSNAAGAYFSDVTFAPSKPGGTSGRFTATEMPGALFDGCRIRGARFEGRPGPRTRFTGFIVRQQLRGKLGGMSALGDCEFRHLLLDNFALEGVALDGRLVFHDCVLDGGTIGGRSAGEAIQVSGDLELTDCQCNALELSGARLTGRAHLLIRGRTSCRGMLFHDVHAAGTASAPAIELDGPDLSGAVFLGCSLRGMHLRGASGTGRLVPAWNLTIRGLNARQPSRLGDLVIEGYDCDGGSFRDLSLAGRLRFLGCSLLRVEMSDIAPERPTAAIDVLESDLLYAEIDEALLRTAVTAGKRGGGLLRISAGQLEAARYTERGRPHLKYGKRKH